jgi:hypothetical protein
VDPVLSALWPLRTEQLLNPLNLVFAVFGELDSIPRYPDDSHAVNGVSLTGDSDFEEQYRRRPKRLSVVYAWAEAGKYECLPVRFHFAVVGKVYKASMC